MTDTDANTHQLLHNNSNCSHGQPFTYAYKVRVHVEKNLTFSLKHMRNELSSSFVPIINIFRLLQLCQNLRSPWNTTVVSIKNCSSI